MFFLAGACKGKIDQARSEPGREQEIADYTVPAMYRDRTRHSPEKEAHFRSRKPCAPKGALQGRSSTSNAGEVQFTSNEKIIKNDAVALQIRAIAQGFDSASKAV